MHDEAFSVKAQELATIYLKTRRKKGSVLLVPVNLYANHPARAAFMQQVLQMDARQWSSYYDTLHFQGVRSVKAVTTTTLMREYLLHVRGAIGYLPTESVTAPLVEIRRFTVAP